MFVMSSLVFVMSSHVFVVSSHVFMRRAFFSFQFFPFP